MFFKFLRHENFPRDLATIHYGDDAANDITGNTLLTAQNRIVVSLQMLLARSNTLWNDAATWYEKKVTLEKPR